MKDDEDLVLIPHKINGAWVIVDVGLWDGNVEGLMRAIYDACGFMEPHLYHDVKRDLEEIKKRYPLGTRDNMAYRTLVHSDLFFAGIEKVIFDKPATIVYWSDGSKTVVVCQEGDIYDEEKGLAMCVAKKALGNNYAVGGKFKKALKTAVRRK